MRIVRLINFVLGLMVFVLSVSAQAKPSSEDFNSMIEENTATQKQLTKQLEQQLNTEKLDRNTHPNFTQVGEEILGKNTSENVVVAGKSEHSKHRVLAKKDVLEKKNFKRLSQELKDIKD